MWKGPENTALLETMLKSVLTSLESGFAIPVAGGPKNHNSAWREHIFIIVIITKNITELLINTWALIIVVALLISPSNSHRLGSAVTGYQGDEPRDMGVLQEGGEAKSDAKEKEKKRKQIWLQQ